MARNPRDQTPGAVLVAQIGAGRPASRSARAKAKWQKANTGEGGAEGGFLHGKRYLILDRDPLYTKEFREMLKAAGVKPLFLPARSPNLNAYAERFVLSVKSECLDRIVPLEKRICGAHYHTERNH